MLHSQNLKQRYNYKPHCGKISASKYIKLEHKDGSNSLQRGSPELQENEQVRRKSDTVAIDAQSNIFNNGDTCHRHLVKTISDLPVFVTIEEYRIASYKIDGESHLCLPQLLLSIKQKFNLEKAVQIFEETITNFSSATPKQVEGFIKASVLPPDAKSCPLIRRSDAERVCLALFDQLSPNCNVNGAIDLCSNTTVSKLRSDTDSQETTKDNDDGTKREAKVNESDQSKLQNSEPFSERESFAHFDVSGSPVPGLNEDLGSQDSGRTSGESQGVEDRNRLSAHNPESPKRQNGLNVKSELLTSHRTDRRKVGDKCLKLSHQSTNQQELSTHSGNDPKLFESEAQIDILNLARDVASTLMIQVYHKCFGKCKGFYYPSLLKNSSSHCIECSCCHILFSPRRFIGHVHGSKEVNVCHWGFNSYNWRHYIRLSKKQSMNNLDDDELLIKFKHLKSIPESDEQLTGVDEEGECTSLPMTKASIKSSIHSDKTIFSPNRDSVGYENLSPQNEELEQQEMLKTEPIISGRDKIVSKYGHVHFKQQQQVAFSSKQAHLHIHYRSSTNIGGQKISSSPYQAQPINYSNPYEAKLKASPRTGPDPCYSNLTTSNINPYSLAGLAPSSIAAALNQAGLDTAKLELVSTSSSPSAISPSSANSTALTTFNNPLHYTNHHSLTSEPITCVQVNYPSTSSAPMLHYSSNAELPIDNHSQQFRHPTYYQPQSESNTTTTTNSLSSHDCEYHQLERNLKRDLFVSTNLATYLESRKIDLQAAEEIVACTLDLINKSRTLF